MYKIEFTKRALRDFVGLEKNQRNKIKLELESLAQNPFKGANIKKLTGMSNSYRLRAGDYRIIYLIEKNKLVINIIKIGHRQGVYK